MRRYALLAVSIMLCAGRVYADTFVLPTNGLAPYTVQLVAHVDDVGPSITLEWPSEGDSMGYTVYRKTLTSSNWGTAIATLASTTTSYEDTNVSVGVDYEYRVAKATLGAWSGYGNGYIYSGIEIPLVEDRGTVVLVVDNTIAVGLALELAQLAQDLIGDGWTVVRYDVSPSDSVTSIQSSIRGTLVGHADLAAVLLIGDIPVPYSGHINPDGHGDHFGAWPADMFYGDLGSTWSDTILDGVTSAADPRNHNIIGDGKFDQDYGTYGIQLAVGRIDMSDLPAFSETETELLVRYFDKNHAYRFKEVVPDTEAVVSDNFGDASGGAYSASAWAGFSTLVGGANITSLVQGTYLSTVSTGNYLWSYGSGPGTYTQASYIATTNQLASTAVNSVFNMLLGSYFGDWDITNNFLRASIAGEGTSLAALWSGTPPWIIHHMGLGKTVGYSTRVSQNNDAVDEVYETNNAPGIGGVHVALMGDPTLRQNIVAPASVLVTTNTEDSIEVSWSASADVSVLGYHVYRSDDEDGPFERLNDVVIDDVTYLDESVEGASAYTYMVRAVTLETTSSGSYYNASQGIFDTITASIQAPTVTTSAVSDIAEETAVLAGSISSTGGETVLERGFIYGETTQYGATTTESGSFGTGSFSASVSGLECATTYYVKAWASNLTGGTAYGAEADFSTDTCPTPSGGGSGSSGGGGGGGSSRPSDTAVTSPVATAVPASVRTALIEKLKELIQELIMLGGKPSAGALAFISGGSVLPAGSVVSSSVFVRDLQLEDVGTDVRALQDFLIHKNSGPMAGQLAQNGATGFFGPLTKSALAEYQTVNGIFPASGYFGPKTKLILGQACRLESSVLRC